MFVTQFMNSYYDSLEVNKDYHRKPMPICSPVGFRFAPPNLQDLVHLSGLELLARGLNPWWVKQFVQNLS